MIIRAAILPHPPLLVPELVGNVRTRTEPVRTACVTAAARLAAAAPDWVAVAADPAGPVTLPAGARGSFAGYGVDVPVTLDPTREVAPDPLLPLPALVAGWLREQAGARRVTVHLVPPDLPPDDCRQVGADIAAGPEPVGLLVLADGASRHTGAAARPDSRAVGFDAGVAAALTGPDPAALLSIDPGLAAELGAQGRAAWQVLAGAALAVGGQWSADLLYSDQPFGVAYHVAVWDPGST
ncbi:MAG TPA: hypothetical protein VHV49_09420 [Pseudonocardiaceae bacterium]|nr:hypothetical protein [Pseudonocardiaceae bacterium]